MTLTTVILIGKVIGGIMIVLALLYIFCLRYEDADTGVAAVVGLGGVIIFCVCLLAEMYLPRPVTLKTTGPPAVVRVEFGPRRESLRDGAFLFV